MQIESKLIMGNFSDIPNPDLSILIPTYGRAKYLEKAKLYKCVYDNERNYNVYFNGQISAKRFIEKYLIKRMIK